MLLIPDADRALQEAFATSSERLLMVSVERVSRLDEPNSVSCRMRSCHAVETDVLASDSLILKRRTSWRLIVDQSRRHRLQLLRSGLFPLRWTNGIGPSRSVDGRFGCRFEPIQFTWCQDVVNLRRGSTFHRERRK